MNTSKGTVAAFMRDTLAAEVAYIYPHAVTFLIKKRVKISKNTSTEVKHWRIYRTDVRCSVRVYGHGDDMWKSEYKDDAFSRIVVHRPKQLTGLPVQVKVTHNVASETLRARNQSVTTVAINLASGHEIDLTMLDGLGSDWSPQTTLNESWVKPQTFEELLKGHKDNYQETFEVIDLTKKPECYHFDTYNSVHRPDCTYDCKPPVVLTS